MFFHRDKWLTSFFIFQISTFCIIAQSGLYPFKLDIGLMAIASKSEPKIIVTFDSVSTEDQIFGYFLTTSNQPCLLNDVNMFLSSRKTPSCLLRFICRHPSSDFRGMNENEVRNELQQHVSWLHFLQFINLRMNAIALDIGLIQLRLSHILK